MGNDTYIGLFRAFPTRDWRVRFPDLPGCEATGASLQETFKSARVVLAQYLHSEATTKPRPRSRAELLSDAQGDWLFCREFVDAVMLPVEAEAVDRASASHRSDTPPGKVSLSS